MGLDPFSATIKAVGGLVSSSASSGGGQQQLAAPPERQGGAVVAPGPRQAPGQGFAAAAPQARPAQVGRLSPLTISQLNLMSAGLGAPRSPVT